MTTDYIPDEDAELELMARILWDAFFENDRGAFEKGWHIEREHCYATALEIRAAIKSRRP